MAPGKITGLGVGVRYDGMHVPFLSRGKNVEYYDAATEDRAESEAICLAMMQTARTYGSLLAPTLQGR